MIISTKWSILYLFFLVMSCTSTNKPFIDYKNPKIEFWGRVDTSNNAAAELYWSGTRVKINVKGGSVWATLQDETGDNYYNVLVDNQLTEVIKPAAEKNTYLIAKGLSSESHTVELFKRTEFDRGKTLFFGFSLDSKAQILPKSVPKKRKIEFYGNSITAGYAVEDISGNDSPDSIFTNNYLSYAAITARHFDAEYRAICKSGIGITVSWFPLIMPQLYDRLNPSDENSKWDFSLFQPDVVVINLFQNDSWIVTMPDYPEFKQKFGNKPPTDEFLIAAYRNFVKSIREKYPQSTLICMLGNMDITKEGSKWPGIVEKAVLDLHDTAIFTHFAPFKESSGHPNIQEQEKLAESLIAFIEKSVKW